jgi:hypothetical protein
MSSQTPEEVKDELISGLISCAQGNIFQWAELDAVDTRREMEELLENYTITKKVSKEVQ